MTTSEKNRGKTPGREKTETKQQCKEKRCIQTPRLLKEENRLLSSLNKSLSNVFTAGQIQSRLYCANHKSVSWEMAMLCTQHYLIPITFKLHYKRNAMAWKWLA